MAIREKDQKLLWGRAAARCAVVDCRVVLTDAVPGTVDAKVVLGEMAHIVGESDGGPRGKSVLTIEQRNSYPNLVLLCGHHHTMIDKNPTAFPIELLHQLKADHEQWVAESLGVVQDVADQVYARVIDDVSLGLDLDHWRWWTDHAVRDLLPFMLAETSVTINERLQATHWPNKHQALDEAAKAAMASFVAFVGHFESFAEMRGDNFLGQDNSLKRLGADSRYAESSAKAEVWREMNFFLLCDLADRVETFAATVRALVNPRFFATFGKFLIYDSMEMRGRGPSFSLSRTEIDDGLRKWGERLDALRKAYKAG